MIFQHIIKYCCVQQSQTYVIFWNIHEKLVGVRWNILKLEVILSRPKFNYSSQMMIIGGAQRKSFYISPRRFPNGWYKSEKPFDFFFFFYCNPIENNRFKTPTVCKVYAVMSLQWQCRPNNFGQKILMIIRL